MTHSADSCRLRRAGVCLGGRDTGYSSCGPCREVRRLAESRLREERRAAGDCVLLMCGKRAVKGRRYCKAHLAYYAERTARAKRKPSQTTTTHGESK